jgi:hypothetical protein
MCLSESTKRLSISAKNCHGEIPETIKKIATEPTENLRNCFLKRLCDLCS